MDDKHNLVVDFDLTNKYDFNALATVAKNESLTSLSDKGYYFGKQIAACTEDNIQTLVSPISKGSKSKDPRVSKNQFEYNKSKDNYTCPKDVTLHHQGKLYNRKDGISYTRYVAHWSECKSCPWVDIRVSAGSQKAKRGRMLNRSIYDDHLEENYARVSARKYEY